MRNYKRDARGRFAKTGTSRRAKKKALKQTYRKAKAASRAQHSRDLERVSKMSEAQYNRYLSKGTFAGAKIHGQDLSDAALGAKMKRDRSAKTNYRMAKRALI